MFRKILAILILTAVGGGVGFAGTQIMPTKWQATAQFEKPKVQELGNYFSLFSTYSLVSGDSIAIDVSKVEERAADSAYEEFKRRLASEDERVQFLAQNEVVRSKAQAENQNVQVVAQQLAKQIQFNSVNGVDELKLTLASSEQADKLMADYLRELNRQTKNVLNNDLVVKWKALFQQVKTAAEAKIDATWENKLNMMKSVQPLDDKLIAFRFSKSPSVTAINADPIQWIGGGAGAGFLLGLLMVLILGTARKEKHIE